MIIKSPKSKNHIKEILLTELEDEKLKYFFGNMLAMIRHSGNKAYTIGTKNLIQRIIGEKNES